jgi:hypothetical protein
MKIFKITPEIEVVCESESTRSGFRHLATLMIDGTEKENGKCTYLNRTWERYEFQSVLYNVIRKAFENKVISEEQKKICDEFIEGDHTDWSGFKTTSMIAQLGEVFCDNQKDKNDWKARMLKAGIQGLRIPEDWDELSEDEKGKRLDKVIALASDVGGKK